MPRCCQCSGGSAVLLRALALLAFVMAKSPHFLSANQRCCQGLAVLFWLTAVHPNKFFEICTVDASLCFEACSCMVQFLHLRSLASASASDFCAQAAQLRIWLQLDLLAPTCLLGIVDQSSAALCVRDVMMWQD